MLLPSFPFEAEEMLLPSFPFEAEEMQRKKKRKIKNVWAVGARFLLHFGCIFWGCLVVLFVCIFGELFVCCCCPKCEFGVGLLLPKRGQHMEKQQGGNAGCSRSALLLPPLIPCTARPREWGRTALKCCYPCPDLLPTKTEKKKREKEETEKEGEEEADLGSCCICPENAQNVQCGLVG